MRKAGAAGSGTGGGVLGVSAGIGKLNAAVTLLHVETRVRAEEDGLEPGYLDRVADVTP